MQLSQILNKLMTDNDVSAYKISQETGISDRLIGYWRKGEKLPGAENLLTIAKYFGVSVDYLLTGNDFNAIGNDGLTMIQRISFLLHTNKKDISDFCKFLDIPEKTYNYWILTGNNPSNEYYPKICEYLQISFAYLSSGDGKLTDVLGFERKEIAMTTNEDEMLIIFRMLNENQQLRLIGRAEEMADQNRKEENVG